MSTQFVTTTRKRKRPQDTYHGCGVWTHFCFRGLWEDEMFARQVLPQASSKSVWIQTKGALLWAHVANEPRNLLRVHIKANGFEVAIARKQ